MSKPVAKRHRSRRGKQAPGVIEKAADNRLRACELRRQGYSYRQISAELGVDIHRAHDYVQGELDELARDTREETEHIRAIELERLDSYLKAVTPAAELGEEKAIATALRIAERRARLLGLDAPTKVDGTMTFLDHIARIVGEQGDG